MLKRKFPKFIYLSICFLLIFQQSGFAQIAGQLDISGHLAAFRNTLISDTFRPLHLRYLSYDSIDNNFKLLLDKGDQFANSRGHFPSGLSGDSLKESVPWDDVKLQEASKTLLKYFFIGISLPNDSFWVNLRPDAEDNIIDDYLARTDIGKIMLESDLQLKKDTAKATSPETPEGRKYWDKLYKKAGELFGSENITIPTLTRPWILPDEIIIRETTDSAYIYKATLKVMLEQDYLKDSAVYNFKDDRLKELNEYSSQLIREIIIPKLTKEVNSSKRYASLRQVYYSLIMAQWFKARFKGLSPQGTVSELIDSQNLTNLTSKESWSKTTYFKEYQKSFKDGEYNIQEPVYTPYGQSIRSYFSGGELLQIPRMPSFGSEITTETGGRVVSLPASRDFDAEDKPHLVEMKIQATDSFGEIASVSITSTVAKPAAESIISSSPYRLPAEELAATGASSPTKEEKEWYFDNGHLKFKDGRDFYNQDTRRAQILLDEGYSLEDANPHIRKVRKIIEKWRDDLRRPMPNIGREDIIHRDSSHAPEDIKTERKRSALKTKGLNRRDFLKAGLVGLGGLVGLWRPSEGHARELNYKERKKIRKFILEQVFPGFVQSFHEKDRAKIKQAYKKLTETIKGNYSLQLREGKKVYIIPVQGLYAKSRIKVYITDWLSPELRSADSIGVFIDADYEDNDTLINRELRSWIEYEKGESRREMVENLKFIGKLAIPAGIIVFIMTQWDSLKDKIQWRLRLYNINKAISSLKKDFAGWENLHGFDSIRNKNYEIEVFTDSDNIKIIVNRIDKNGQPRVSAWVRGDTSDGQETEAFNSMFERLEDVLSARFLSTEGRKIFDLFKQRNSLFGEREERVRRLSLSLPLLRIMRSGEDFQSYEDLLIKLIFFYEFFGDTVVRGALEELGGQGMSGEAKFYSLLASYEVGKIRSSYKLEEILSGLESILKYYTNYLNTNAKRLLEYFSDLVNKPSQPLEVPSDSRRQLSSLIVKTLFSRRAGYKPSVTLDFALMRLAGQDSQLKIELVPVLVMNSFYKEGDFISTGSSSSEQSPLYKFLSSLTTEELEKLRAKNIPGLMEVIEAILDNPYTFNFKMLNKSIPNPAYQKIRQGLVKMFSGMLREEDGGKWVYVLDYFKKPNALYSLDRNTLTEIIALILEKFNPQISPYAGKIQETFSSFLESADLLLDYCRDWSLNEAIHQHQGDLLKAIGSIPDTRNRFINYQVGTQHYLVNLFNKLELVLAAFNPGMLPYSEQIKNILPFSPSFVKALLDGSLNEAVQSSGGDEYKFILNIFTDNSLSAQLKMDLVRYISTDNSLRAQLNTGLAGYISDAAYIFSQDKAEYLTAKLIEFIKTSNNYEAAGYASEVIADLYARFPGLLLPAECLMAMERVTSGNMDIANPLDLLANYLNLKKALQLSPVRREITHADFYKFIQAAREGREVDEDVPEEHNRNLRAVAYEAFVAREKILELPGAKVVVGNESYGGRVALAPVTEEINGDTFIAGTDIAVWYTKVGSTESHNNEFVLPDNLFKPQQLRVLIEKNPTMVIVDASTSVASAERTSPHIPDAFKGYRNFFIILNYALYGEVKARDFLVDDDFVRGLLETSQAKALLRQIQGLNINPRPPKNAYQFHFSYERNSGPSDKDEFLYLRVGKQKDTPAPKAEISKINRPAAIFLQSAIHPEDIDPSILKDFIGGRYTPAFFDDRDHFKEFYLSYEEGYGVVPSKRYVYLSRQLFREFMRSQGRTLAMRAATYGQVRPIETVVLDLDGTLANIDAVLDSNTANILNNLLREEKRVVIITDDLEESVDRRLRSLRKGQNLFIFSDGGAKGYSFNAVGDKFYFDDYNAKSKITVDKRENIVGLISSNFSPGSWQLEDRVERISSDQRIDLRNVQDRTNFVKKSQSLLLAQGISAKVYRVGKTSVRVVLQHKEHALKFFLGELKADRSKVVIVADKAHSYQIDRELLTCLPEGISVNVGGYSPSIGRKNPNIVQYDRGGIPATLRLLSNIELFGGLPENLIISSAKGQPWLEDELSETALAPVSSPVSASSASSAVENAPKLDSKPALESSLSLVKDRKSAGGWLKRGLAAASKSLGSSQDGLGAQVSSSPAPSAASSSSAESAENDPAKFGQCLTPDSLIYLADGTVKPLIELKEGEYVLSLNEATGKLEPHQVNALLDMGVKPVYRIRTKSGKELKTTLNHPYLTKDGWRKLKDIEIGEVIAAGSSDPADAVAVFSGNDQAAQEVFFRDAQDKVIYQGKNFSDIQQMNPQANNPATRIDRITQDIGKIRVPGDENERFLFDQFVDFFISCGGVNISNVLNLMAFSFKKLAYAPGAIGVNQKLHGVLSGLADKFFFVCQKGGIQNTGLDIFVGDGRKFLFDSLYIHPASHSLEDNMRRSARSFDTRLAMLDAWFNANMFIKQFFIKHFISLQKQIYHIAEFLSRQFTEEEPTGSDILWDKIVSIEPLGPQQVYDIEVQGTHNFVANGIVAHNTYQNAGDRKQGTEKEPTASSVVERGKPRVLPFLGYKPITQEEKKAIMAEYAGITEEEFNKKALFHGTFKEFIELDQSMIGVDMQHIAGTGVYFADKETAQNYAELRVKVRGGIPRLIAAQVIRKNFLDISKDDKLPKDIADGWKERLMEFTRDKKWFVISAAQEAIDKINLGNYRIKDVTWNFPDQFSEYMKSLGFDGLILTELGEGSFAGAPYKSTVVYDLNNIITFETVKQFKLLAEQGKVSTSLFSGEKEQTSSSISNKGGIDGLASSPSIPQETKAPGGVDFRALPIVTRAMSNLSLNVSRIPLSSIEGINLDQELREIQRLVKAGITPSADRIREYVQVSCLKGNSDMRKVVSCIADILRLEEERSYLTDTTLKDILVVLESGRPAQELKEVFTGANS